MVGYQNAFRPASVRLAQAPAAPAATVSVTPAQRNMAIALGAAETGFGVVATWVGVRAGMREKGIFSALGYAVAAGGGLFALVNLMGTVGMLAGADKA
jgi:hypothetical protein